MTAIKASVPPGGPPPMRSAILREFSGGLNLATDDFEYAINEVSSCYDCEPSALGGIVRRSSFRALGNTGLSTSLTPKFLYQFGSDVDDNGTILVGGSDGTHDRLAYWTTGNISDGHARTGLLTFTNDSTLGKMWSAFTMKPITSAGGSLAVYIHRDVHSKVQTFQTDNTLHTELDDPYGHYNENFDNPLGGYMPLADIGVNHLVYAFHANTYENSIQYQNRVRWSHPGYPGDYRANDFLDIGEGQDNDRITALASWNTTLFIFKAHSVWALTGYDANTFAVQRIANFVGAPNKNAVVSTPSGVYFFDAYLGVQQIQQEFNFGSSRFHIVPMWTKLNPAIDDGRIVSTTNATLSFAGGKLYVSGFKTAGATASNRTFVFDTNNATGWWRYGVGFNILKPMIWNTGEQHIMGAGPYSDLGGHGSSTYRNFVCIQELLSTDVDDNFDASTDLQYTGSFTTAWIDGGDSGMKKRFRRFSLVFKNMAATSPFTFSTYRNFSTSTPSPRQGTLAGTADPSAADYGMSISKRGIAIGTGYAAALSIVGPNDKQWVVNSVTFRFIPLRVV